jgi:hypothetical protein
MSNELAVALVAGIFGLIPLIVQILTQGRSAQTG